MRSYEVNEVLLRAEEGGYFDALLARWETLDWNEYRSGCIKAAKELVGEPVRCADVVGIVTNILALRDLGRRST